jgi:hypothetical protein
LVLILKTITCIVAHEVYTFLDGFSGYHQISITLENQHKTTFVIKYGCFFWVVMPFGVKKKIAHSLEGSKQNII